MTATTQPKRVLLIGGAGFIGHNLALALTRIGAPGTPGVRVSIVDSLQVNNLLSFAAAADTSPNRGLYLRVIQERLDLLRAQEIELHVQDARDEHALGRLFARIQPQVVVHLAGISHAVRSNADPHAAFEHTLRTLENALDCSRTGVEHFIYFSSSMVYGHFNGGFVTEETPCEPLGIYGALKYAGEKMVIARHQVTGLPYTIIRPSALYGERCVSRRVVQVFLENALQDVELSVAGGGEDRLDFTYIDDLVAGILRILHCQESRNEIFNLTYGCSRSIGEVADLLGEHFPGIKVAYQPKDRLMPDRGTLCIDKARTLLGYDPQYSLDRGLARYIWWYRSHGELLSRCAAVSAASAAPKPAAVAV